MFRVLAHLLSPCGPHCSHETGQDSRAWRRPVSRGGPHSVLTPPHFQLLVRGSEPGDCQPPPHRRCHRLYGNGVSRSSRHFHNHRLFRSSQQPRELGRARAAAAAATRYYYHFSEGETSGLEEAQTSLQLHRASGLLTLSLVLRPAGQGSRHGASRPCFCVMPVPNLCIHPPHPALRTLS